LQAPFNRPGLNTIRSRVGDYGSFMADAKRNLSSRSSPNLQLLGTRDATDPTIALLDAWAITADVLTFYRERLTQEGYLRTATDERSIRELAHLVGFKPRPGIAATAHLAYVLDSSAKPVDIDPGAKVQTSPGPGETMQTFETDKTLSARAEWSQIKPRLTRPPNIDVFYALTQSTIRLTDISLGVRPGERLLFMFEPDETSQWQLPVRVVREVLSAKANIESGFFEVTLKPKDWLANLEDPSDFVDKLLEIQNEINGKAVDDDPEQKTIKIFLLDVISSYFLGSDARGVLSMLAFKRMEFEDFKDFGGLKDKLIDIFKTLTDTDIPPVKEQVATSVDKVLKSIRNAGKGSLESNGAQQTDQGNDSNGVMRTDLVKAMLPVYQTSLNAALGGAPANPVPKSAPAVYLLRTVMSPFGAVAPKNMSSKHGEFLSEEWLLDGADTEDGAAFLETMADSVTADSFGVVQTPIQSWVQNNESESGLTSEGVFPQRLFRFVRIRSTQTEARSAYNVSAKVTRLELANADSDELLTVIPPQKQKV
jgi:hypothetical protein